MKGHCYRKPFYASSLAAIIELDKSGFSPNPGTESHLFLQIELHRINFKHVERLDFNFFFLATTMLSKDSAGAFVRRIESAAGPAGAHCAHLPA